MPVDLYTVVPSFFAEADRHTRKQAILRSDYLVAVEVCALKWGSVEPAQERRPAALSDLRGHGRPLVETVRTLLRGRASADAATESVMGLLLAGLNIQADLLLQSGDQNLATVFHVNQRSPLVDAVVVHRWPQIICAQSAGAHQTGVAMDIGRTADGKHGAIVTHDGSIGIGQAKQIGIGQGAHIRTKNRLGFNSENHPGRKLARTHP